MTHMDVQNITKLEEALEVLCFDCTRYDASDELAKLLAVMSLTPYLAILHVASVSTPPASLPNDGRAHKAENPRACIALCLDSPTGSSDCVIMQVIYSRRQLHDVLTLMGMVVCAALAKFLKAALRHSRYCGLSMPNFKAMNVPIVFGRPSQAELYFSSEQVHCCTSIASASLSMLTTRRCLPTVMTTPAILLTGSAAF